MEYAALLLGGACLTLAGLWIVTGMDCGVSGQWCYDNQVSIVGMVAVVVGPAAVLVGLGRFIR